MVVPSRLLNAGWGPDLYRWRCKPRTDPDTTPRLFPWPSFGSILAPPPLKPAAACARRRTPPRTKRLRVSAALTVGKDRGLGVKAEDAEERATSTSNCVLFSVHSSPQKVLYPGGSTANKPSQPSQYIQPSIHPSTTCDFLLLHGRTVGAPDPVALFFSYQVLLASYGALLHLLSASSQKDDRDRRQQRVSANQRRPITPPPSSSLSSK